MGIDFVHNYKSLDELPITPVHRERLKWFLEHEGQIVSYAVISAITSPWLTARAKGIYKPEGWTYSLSIKETLNSPYGDVPIMTLANGDWVYKYHRETGVQRATNLGLIKCMSDQIPVGVMIQVEPKPNVKYFIAGLGLIRAFKDPWFDLVNWQASFDSDDFNQLIAEPAVEYDEGQKQANLPGFMLMGNESEHYSQQLVRPNQPMFRVMLLSTYEKTCAVTKTTVIPALEAAHIRPYSYEKIDKVQNGLLLRADIHRLFDRGYLGVDTSHMETVISKKLIGSDYEQFAGKPLALPSDEALHPSNVYLDEHRKAWKLT